MVEHSKEYELFVKGTTSDIFQLLKTKTVKEVRTLTLSRLVKSLENKDVFVNLLFSDEHFLSICKEELNFNPNEKIKFLDELLKAYETNVKVFVVKSKQHEDFIIAHNDKEINNAILIMHKDILPDTQNEEFGITISVQEFSRSEYDKLISKSWYKEE